MMPLLLSDDVAAPPGFWQSDVQRNLTRGTTGSATLEASKDRRLEPILPPDHGFVHRNRAYDVY